MQKENKGSIDLTRGSIPGGILAFAIPLFLGQLLQQLYNMVDAWVIGNFADNDVFSPALPPAAVSLFHAILAPAMKTMFQRLSTRIS